MFAVMNINSIPAVYLTAQVAAFSIIFLYLAVVFCFPAYCYLDMKRQDAGRHDILFWKTRTSEVDKEDSHYLERLLYNRCYKPLILGESYIRIITHSLIWACAALLLGLGLYGISVSTVGLGLEVCSFLKKQLHHSMPCFFLFAVRLTRNLLFDFRIFCHPITRDICGLPPNPKYWDPG